jgi:hypothetical protein
MMVMIMIIVFFFNLIAVNRFAGIVLEDLVGEIYPLCKDQHGCRYLQKKLEEKNEQYIGMIFNEVFGHFVELMTGKLIYTYFFIMLNV